MAPRNQKLSRSKYLLKNTAIFTIGSFSTKLISFLLVPLYTNALTSDQYGVADLVTTLCTVMAPILILNVSDGIMRFALDKDADHIKIMSVGLTVLGIALIAGLLIIPISVIIDQLSSYAGLIYLYTLSLAGSQIFLYYLRGRERLVEYAIGNIIQTASIALLNIVFLLKFDLGLFGYFMSYIVASGITILYAFFAGDILEVIQNFCFDTSLAKRMVSYSIVLVPNTFLWWIINSSDRVFVTAMIGVSANGIYAVSYKIPTAVSVIASIFNQAWSYSAIHENESSDRDQYASKMYSLLLTASILTGIGLLLVMKPLMKALVEDSYFDAWQYTSPLIIGNVFMTTGTYLSSWYTVNKDSKGFVFSAACGALVNVTFNLVLIPLYGVMGSAVATLVSMFAVFLYRAIDVRKYITIQLINRRQALAYILLFLSGITVYLEGALGNLLLLAELVLAAFILRVDWIPLASNLLRLIKRRFV